MLFNARQQIQETEIFSISLPLHITLHCTALPGCITINLHTWRDRRRICRQLIQPFLVVTNNHFIDCNLISAPPFLTFVPIIWGLHQQTVFSLDCPLPRHIHTLPHSPQLIEKCVQFTFRRSIWQRMDKGKVPTRRRRCIDIFSFSDIGTSPLFKGKRSRQCVCCAVQFVSHAIWDAIMLQTAGEKGLWVVCCRSNCDKCTPHI